MNLKKLLTLTIIILVGLFTGLVLAELAFRFIKPQKNSIKSDRPSFYFKDQKARSMRDFYYTTKKPEHAFRIMVVGDSYTFAPFMQFTDTFPKKLEQMLNLNKVELKAQVLNYGFPAFSTTHHIDTVKAIMNASPDLIIMQVTLNDAELKPYWPGGINTNSIDPFGALIINKKSSFILKHSKLAAFVASRIHNVNSYKKYKNYYLNLYRNERNWSQFKAAWQKIIERCHANKVKLVAVIFPLFGLELNDSYPFLDIHKKISAFFNESNLPHLDLFNDFKNIPLERLQVMPNIDRHPNEIAHRIAAESIYTWLAEDNLIPKRLKIRERYKQRLGGRGTDKL